MLDRSVPWRSLRALSLPFVAALAVGCSASTSYPSLAPRAVEKVDISAEPAAPAAAQGALPVDSERDARVAVLLAQAREAAAAFDTAMSAAQPLVAAAGGAGSESWVAAQVAVSGVERARGALVGIVADLDALRIAQAQRQTPADSSALEAAWREASALDAAQAAALAALRASLPTA